MNNIDIFDLIIVFTISAPLFYCGIICVYKALLLLGDNE